MEKFSEEKSRSEKKSPAAPGKISELSKRGGPESSRSSAPAEEEAKAAREEETAVREEATAADAAAAAKKQIEAAEQEQAAAEQAEAMADLQQQLLEIEDRWKRAVADLDNYRKRFERELERLRFAERDSILREWLAVVDNMERALHAGKAQEEDPWYQGMKAIHQQMIGVLGQFLVTPFNPKGEPFDPVRHDAVATVDLKDEQEGTIAEVVEPGYTINDRILRPAKVIPVRHQNR